MAKPNTILYLENNPLDRAVLDLHISENPAGAAEFALRYSFEGRLLEATDILEPTGKIKPKWKPSTTMILFDLGLSARSEKLLPNPAVRNLLASHFLAKYLTYEVRTIPPRDRLDNFKRTYPDAWEYVNQIEGLYTLLKVRLAQPDILCGIVSHYVNDDIRDVLSAFVMHGWPIDFAEYESEVQPQPFVIHKGDLAGISHKLKLTWDMWQAVRSESYCKDVVPKILVQAADGSVKGLAEHVDVIQGNEELRPDDGQSPIFICDFLGLLDFPRATRTVERLFKRVFRSLRLVKAQDLSPGDRTGQYLLLDTEGPGLGLKEAIKQILHVHDLHGPKQLVCVVRGRAEDEDKVSKVFRDLRVRNSFWYTMPSLPLLISNNKYNTFAFDRFIKAVVTSACEYAVYEHDSKVEGGERFLNDLQGWLKTLPTKAVPPSLTTFWNCVCEVFEKQIQAEMDVKTLFDKKVSAELERTATLAELERRGPME